MSNIIQIEKLVKEYGSGREKVQALYNVDFILPEGESLAIVGPSGSGKTTLLQILGGLDRQDSGKVFIDGQEVKKMTDDQLSKFRNKTIGFVFQFFNLLDYMTAKENVAIPMIIAGVKNKDAYSKAEELLKEVGLAERMHHYPKALSGGEMQRVAVARALGNNPKILLADEPTGNLDAENAERVMTLLNSIAAKGVSVIVITHDQDIAKQFQNTLKLNKGKVAFA